MKNIARMLALFIIMAFCLTAVIGCTNDTPDINENLPDDEPKVTVDASYRIVVASDADNAVRKAADMVAASIKEKAGIELTVVSDAEAATECEIVLGNTNRSRAEPSDSAVYSVSIKNKSIYINAGDSVTLYYAALAVTEAWLTEDFGLAEDVGAVLYEKRIGELNGLAIKSENSIKVLSQNLRFANDPNGNSVAERATRFKRLFEEYMPDLIGTQEATREWNNLLELFCYMFSDREYGMESFPRDGAGATGECNTILYRKDRFELLDSDTTWLSSTPDEVSCVDGSCCMRICTWVLLKDKQTGETILFANTHLDYSNDDVRSAQINILMDYFADRVGQYPFYLTGDFNFTPDSTPYDIATSKLNDSHLTAWTNLSTVDGTYHDYGKLTDNKIDFCFHNDKTTPISCEIISKDYGGFVSDH